MSCPAQGAGAPPLSAICAVPQGTEPSFEVRRLRDIAGTRQCRPSGQLLLREPLNRRRGPMSSGPMSKGENAQSARVLRDDELDFVSGGLKVTMEDILVTSVLKVDMEDIIITC